MKTVPKLLMLFIIVISLTVVIFCTPPAQGPGPDTAPVVEYIYSVADPVYTIPFSDHPYLKVEVTGDLAAGLQLFLVKSNNSTSVVSASGSGSVVNYTDPPPQQLFNRYDVNGKSVIRNEFLPATMFNANPPPLDYSYLGRSRASPFTYGNPDPDLTADSINGTERNFWVATVDQNNNISWSELTARLIAIGQYSYIWIDVNRLDEGSVIIDDNAITSEQVIELGNFFDGSADLSYSDGIFNLVTNIFGYEYGGGSGGDGGIDSDQHISILIYDIDNDGPVSSGVVGYFWSKDIFPDSSLPPGWHSNLAEMFYLDANFIDIIPGFVRSTLAHEFQHMINFNEKYIQHSVNSGVWYNEMMSMVCEDLISSNLDFADLTEDSPRSRLSRFNSGYYRSGVTDWLGDDVLYSYAGAYTFGAFLARNYGGAELFQNISANSMVNIASIDDAIQQTGFSGDFDTVFAGFSTALLFDTIHSPKVKIFRSFDSTVDTIGYHLSGFSLEQVEQTYAPGVYGPCLFAPDQQIELRPYGLSVHTSDSWDLSDVTLSVILKKPASSVDMYLMIK